MKAVLSHQGRIAILIAFAITCASCAGRSNVVVTPITETLAQYPTLAVSVDSTITDDEDIGEDIDRLKDSIIDAITDADRFSAVTAADTNESAAGTLVLSATITQIRRVGGAARFFGGVLAGRAGITLDVKLTNARTGEIVGETEIVGNSGGTGLSGGTGEAVGEASKGIVEWLAEPGED